MEQKKAVLAVSFGTSYKKARENALGGIEQYLGQIFPGYPVRRCFTSSMVIRHIEQSEGVHIENPREALENMDREQIRELWIQPTHIMAGFEYQKFCSALEEYRSHFEQVRMGKPLLSDPEDYEKVIQAICMENGTWEDGKTAVILAGHGSGSDGDQVYETLQQLLWKKGRKNYYVGTIESRPSAEELKEQIRPEGYQRVILLPLMVVAGDHAANDIAGQEDSWKQLFEQAGYEVIPVMKGLGEYPGIQAIYGEHLRNAETYDGKNS